jgi:tRNA U34 5-carboxymethylaminomethyl modifying enzyme MnmG/GidA
LQSKSRNADDVPRGTVLASEAKQPCPCEARSAEATPDCFVGLRPPRNDASSAYVKPPRNDEANHILEAVEIMIKYKGYIERERTLADKMIRLEDVRIPRGFDFDKLTSVSIEGRQKLKRYQPETIGQASRITGISPADISVMLIYFGR